MGKQGRRKQRQKRKQQALLNKNSDRPSVNPSSAIHQLRHADPKIRHAALVAMQATVLDHASKRAVSLPVLEAIREQVMDQNLECASAAAECLAQYFSLGSCRYPEATASWTLVLLNRLEYCHQTIRQHQQQQSMNNNNNHSLKQCYALASPCARTLCKLVEMNELALDRLNSQTQAFLTTTIGLLQDTVNFDDRKQQEGDDGRVNEWIQQTAAFAARTLHSALDDNEQIIKTIEIKEEVWMNVLQGLHSCPLAQLHLAGCMVIMYQEKYEASSLSWLQAILTCLMDKLDLQQQDDAIKTCQDNFRAAKQLRQSQKKDSELEQEIIQKIQARREPARQIARRQKETPRPQQRQHVASMMAEDSQPQQQEDGQQAMEDALAAWNDIFQPFQVSLEVTANLLSSWIQPADAMAVEDDDFKTNQHTMREHQDLVRRARLPELLLHLLRSLCKYSSGVVYEDGLREEIQESISKSSACLTNCILARLLIQPQESQQTWQLLRPLALEPGVSSVLVVLAQQQQQLGSDIIDFELVQGLLRHQQTPALSNNSTNTNDDILRDGVCLLALALNSKDHSITVEVVTQMSRELLRLLQGTSPVVQAEVLNAIMDLYGQDDFYPQVFLNLKLLDHFQRCLANMPKLVDPEMEDILFNANRFVDYKLGR